jgi:hypothetical protein
MNNVARALTESEVMNKVAKDTAATAAEINSAGTLLAPEVVQEPLSMPSISGGSPSIPSPPAAPVAPSAVGQNFGSSINQVSASFSDSQNAAYKSHEQAAQVLGDGDDVNVCQEGEGGEGDSSSLSCLPDSLSWVATR